MLFGKHPYAISPTILPSAIGISAAIFGGASLVAYSMPKDKMLSAGKMLPAGSENHDFRWYSSYNMWNDCEICQKYEQILKKNKYIDGWLMCGIIQM